MSAAAIRVFGILTLAFDALVLLDFNRRRFFEGPFPLRTFIGVGICVLAIAVVGIGLLLLRKWAAVVFALTLVASTVWATIGSFGEAPWGLYPLIAAFAIVIILSVIVIARSWRLLSWRGKWLL